ncbi:retrovirus-related pol polyprotein from transposon TNT 1-94 [Tanacetum coccineum]
MELYMMNRQHGRMILESVENGPLIWPSIEENRVTRLKKYFELSATEAIQADCDIKATNIILQGLPPEVYALVSDYKIAKELWERIQLLMQGTSLIKQERECKLYDEFDKFAYKKGETLHPLALVATHQMTQSPYQTHHNSYQNAQFQPQVSPYQSPQYGLPYRSQQYSTHQSSTPLSITYPSNEYQSSIYHNIYSPSSSILQLEYAPTVNQQSEFSQPDLGIIVPVFQKGDDPIDAINHMMSFLTACPSCCVTDLFNVTVAPDRISKLSDLPSSSLDERSVDVLMDLKVNNLYTSLGTHDASSPIWSLVKIGLKDTKSWAMASMASTSVSSELCKKKPHKPKSEDTNQDKLYLLHMDLCGPMRVARVNGKKYIFVIVNDYSRFTWVKFLRSKDEAPDFIIKFLKMIQVRLKVPVRRIKTNNGTKFVNQTLRKYYEKVGIYHETSVAHSPQQNDVVERHNRTLIEAARTMLIYANAPLFLWAEVVATAYFDELTIMASEQSSSGPALHERTPATISSGLVPNDPPLIPFVPPSRTDWDMLFQPLFDELLTPPPSVDHPALEVIAPIAEVVAPEPAASTGSPSSTNINKDAPSPSNSQTTPDTQPLIIPNDVKEDNHDIEVAYMGNDPYFGIPIIGKLARPVSTRL